MPARKRGTEDIGWRLLAGVADAPDEGCWEWKLGTDRKGYGRISVDGKARRVHRLAYVFVHGPLPGGMFVCHRCDNPRCVRIDHLYAGTPAQNFNDKLSRYRFPSGARGAGGKLTARDVVLIRHLSAEGWTQEAIAKRFAVCSQTISAVMTRRNWGHV